MYLKWFFPSGIKLCPLSGKYDSENVMFYSDEKSDFNNTSQTFEDQKALLGVLIPNGIYRTTLKISTPADPMVYRIQYYTEVKNRLMEDRFK